MKTNILRRIAAVLAAVILCVTVTGTASSAKAKAKPTISDTKLTMMTNDISAIRLKGASSKVIWKSSNKNMVKIEKTSGKYAQEVSLKTGNRTGRCTIRAKMENKTYSCKITVKKGDIIKKYSGKKSKTVLEKITQTKKSLTIRYRMCSAAYSPKRDSAGYGYGIELEKYTNGKWNRVPMKYSLCYCDVMFIIPPKTSISTTVHLEDYYEISELTAGSYRLNVNVFYPDVNSPYVKFKLE